MWAQGEWWLWKKRNETVPLMVEAEAEDENMSNEYKWRLYSRLFEQEFLLLFLNGCKDEEEEWEVEKNLKNDLSFPSNILIYSLPRRMGKGKKKL